MNVTIEIRSKVVGPLDEALPVAQAVCDIREFEVYLDGSIAILDLDVVGPVDSLDLHRRLFDEFVEGLRYYGSCMVCMNILAPNGVELYRRAYGTRQGPGAL